MPKLLLYSANKSDATAAEKLLVHLPVINEAAFVASSTAVQPAEGNLLFNPSLEMVDFDNDSLATGWQSQKEGESDTKFTRLNFGHTGSSSLKVEVSNHVDGVSYYQFTPLAILGGGTCDYSVRYLSNTYSEVNAVYAMNDGSTEYQYLGVSYPSPNGWSTLTTRLVPPEGAVTVSIYNLLYNNGTLITDDYVLTRATVVPFDRPMVTITFDDAFESFYENAFPLFQKYHMDGTIYLVSNDFKAPRFMSVKQIKELEEHGFEIGSHSVSHAHLPALSSKELRYELEESKRVIEKKLGHPIEAFAAPYGEYNDFVQAEIMKVYDSHRSVDVGFNTKDNLTKKNIRAMSAVVDTEPETVLGWVDTAIANGAWLSLVYHDIVEDGGMFTNTPDHLEAVLAGLAARDIDVVTNKEALEYIESKNLTTD